MVGTYTGVQANLKPPAGCHDETMNLPQSHNMALLIKLLAHLTRAPQPTAALASAAHLDARTTREVLGLASWLGLTEASGRAHQLTDAGELFVERLEGRGGMIQRAILRDPLMQEALARCGERPGGDRRALCEGLLKEVGGLAASTLKRRAASMDHLVQIAQDPSRIDWFTGARAWRDEDASLEDELPDEDIGRTFLNAMAGRRFGARTVHLISAPAQLVAYLDDPLYTRGDDPDDWREASVVVSWGGELHRWFGGVPLTLRTRHAARDVPKLQHLLITCAPAVALLVALVTFTDRRGRRPVTLRATDAGADVLVNGRALPRPALLPTLERLARALELEWVAQRPGADGALHAPMTDAQLLDVALRAHLLHHSPTDGALHPTPELIAELDRPQEGRQTLGASLFPLQMDLGLLLKRWQAGLSDATPSTPQDPT